MGDHTETFQVDFDPSVLPYPRLLDHFWASHRPGSAGYGRQYLVALFPADDAQERQAEESRGSLAERLGRKLGTPILRLERFYRAEDYHQKYYLRRHPELVGELRGRGYDERRIADSTVAARLNAFVSGNGTLSQLANELPGFGLSAKGEQALTRLTQHQAALRCGS